MTIKDFSRLCGCNPKTLRYYDQIGLLKPVRVDRFSGYRYYEEQQALTFVKIRNLQSAGFSIEEIKGLLDSDDSVIYAAFDKKIAECEARLEKIREIQKSYHSEMKQMDDMLNEIKEHVKKAMAEYDPRDEFGLQTDDYDALIGSVMGYLDDVYSRGGEAEMDFKYNDDEDAPEDEEYADAHDFLNDPEYGIVYENHNWQSMSECISHVAAAAADGEYVVCVKLVKEKVSSLDDGLAIAFTMLGVALGKNPDAKRDISCNVTHSEDGMNHIWLMKRNKN